MHNPLERIDSMRAFFDRWSGACSLLANTDDEVDARCWALVSFGWRCDSRRLSSMLT
jgi:hypothetical protein